MMKSCFNISKFRFLALFPYGISLLALSLGGCAMTPFNEIGKNAKNSSSREVASVIDPDPLSCTVEIRQDLSDPLNMKYRIACDGTFDSVESSTARMLRRKLAEIGPSHFTNTISKITKEMVEIGLRPAGCSQIDLAYDRTYKYKKKTRDKTKTTHKKTTRKTTTALLCNYYRP